MWLGNFCALSLRNAEAQYLVYLSVKLAIQNALKFTALKISPREFTPRPLKTRRKREGRRSSRASIDMMTIRGINITKDAREGKE
jgi:hypothetical protein